MKRILFTNLLIMLSLVVYSQYDDDEFKTIFGGQVTRISAFGAPTMNLTSVNKNFAMMMGGGGGIIFNNKVFIGGYGVGLSTDDIRLKNEVYPANEFNFGHGGFWFGIIPGAYRALHSSLSLQTGWGSIGGPGKSDEVFVLTPIFEFEMNFTRFFKVGIGANYRIVAGVNNLDGNKSSDFSSPGLFTSFKFGWF